MKRRINVKKLRELVDQQGLGRISDTTGVSVSWFQKTVTGKYDHAPGKPIRNSICSKYLLDENELFPLVGAKGKAS